MKRIFAPFAIVCLSVMTFASCKKDIKETDVSTETLNQIRSLGFSTDVY
ncbi:MAG: hypothetical protein JWP69_796 [Flaviaesturariibacter sp.]|nr:hypothetical protein [Flaviaesturariibacter sp.]